MITDTVQQPGKITMLQIGIALFLGCFFFGSILSNFIWQDTAWWIGSAGETDWQQILADGEQRERFWGQVLILRGIPWIVLQMFLFISWGRWVFAGWYGWLGVSGGMVTGAFWNRNGLAGIGQVLGFCFPQMLVYGVAYFGLLLLLVAWQKLRKERRNAVVMHRNRNGKTLAVFVFLLLCNTGIYTMGIWLELVVNPWVATFSMQLPIK